MINYAHTEILWEYSEKEPVEFITTINPDIYSTIHSIRITNKDHYSSFNNMSFVNVNTQTINNIKTEINSLLINIPTIRLDLTKFINLNSLYITGMHIDEIILPLSMTLLKLSFTKIEKQLYITPDISTLYIWSSPDIWNMILGQLNNITNLTVYCENINIIDISKINKLSLYKCTINSIINAEHNIYNDSWKNMTLDIYECNTPYNLRDLPSFYIDEIDVEIQYRSTILYNINNIYNTNQWIEKNKFTELMVRCRLNIFKQETHINNSGEDNDKKEEGSQIYKALRLGSNYQRRCIEFIY
jgi:hypothetical protein